MGRWSGRGALEAAEEAYFWPAVKEKVSDGDSFAAGGIAVPL
jgi:hypothetical protein